MSCITGVIRFAYDVYVTGRCVLPKGVGLHTVAILTYAWLVAFVMEVSNAYDLPVAWYCPSQICP